MDLLVSTEFKAVKMLLMISQGVRNTDHNTAFPAGITVGATFDKSLMLRRGVAIGEEFRGKGVNIHLGPSVGALGRKPRGGRSKLSTALQATSCD
jgi:beta-glucosidase-like glycosyl hydrolase